MNKTEYDIICQDTISRGGDWTMLYNSEKGAMYSSVMKYTYKRQQFYARAIYHIFNLKGNRLTSTRNFWDAYNYFKNLA